MNNYQIFIEYEGTDFVGWQIQKNGPSIQEVVQIALKRYFKKKVILKGAGRTDAGVHAYRQSASFCTEEKIKSKNSFINSVNFFLKKYPISIIELKNRKKNFHARFSAKKRIYKYLIINREGALSIDKNRGWLIKKKLNINSMKIGAKILIGTHDFSIFRASTCGAKSPIKTINKVSITQVKDRISITFESRSFLQQQVRSMVGCLKYLGENKWSPRDFRAAIESRKRSKCAPPAPSYGLYLFDIKY